MPGCVPRLAPFTLLSCCAGGNKICIQPPVYVYDDYSSVTYSTSFNGIFKDSFPTLCSLSQSRSMYHSKEEANEGKCKNYYCSNE